MRTEGIVSIPAPGGAPVLAHPASLRMPERELRAYVQRLTAWGLRGIEVHRPDHTPDRRASRPFPTRQGLSVAWAGWLSQSGSF